MRFEDVAQAMGLKNVETDYTVHTVASDFPGDPCVQERLSRI